MQTLQGIAVSPGVAVGEALVLDTEGFRTPRRFIASDAVEPELARLNSAIDAVAADIERNQTQISAELGEKYGAIFSAHAQMLRDERLHTELEQLVRQRNFSPEYAVSRTLRRYAKVFQKLENRYLAERAHDIFDIEKSLLRNLMGADREELSHLQSSVLILAHDLTPSETASLDRENAKGFATEIGGAGGHTAIVAKALEIPSVVGIGPFLAHVSAGDQIIIDGDHGLVIIKPDEETLERYRCEAEQHRNVATQLDSLRELPAETGDGQRICILANIEFPHEVKACCERGADGIGLYRTEFLYLAGATEPTEEDHYQAYSQVVQALGQRPVVIRTLDLGADKLVAVPDRKERNPFLGLRSIRLSLKNPTLFRTQLRAILRASVRGNVHLMFPLITSLSELQQAKQQLTLVMEELDDAGVPFQRDLPVGMMVETPAAVTMLDRLAREVDFVSIGTNDLVQYTLAVDRSNIDVAHLYQSGDPAVLRLVKQAIDVTHQAGIPVTICGQMSADPKYTMLLLGLGLRQWSVPPSAILEIKKICRGVDLAHCRSVAEQALKLDCAADVDAFLRDELKKIAPEFVVC